jgi:hypothetical protein
MDVNAEHNVMCCMVGDRVEFWDFVNKLTLGKFLDQLHNYQFLRTHSSLLNSLYTDRILLGGVYFCVNSRCLDFVHCLVFKKTLVSETDHGRSPYPKWL